MTGAQEEQRDSQQAEGERREGESKAAVQLECVMAVDSGGPDGVGVLDDASPTPDTALVTFNVQVP